MRIDQDASAGGNKCGTTPPAVAAANARTCPAAGNIHDAGNGGDDEDAGGARDDNGDGHADCDIGETYDRPTQPKDG